jgi:hypothetical protein
LIAQVPQRSPQEIAMKSLIIAAAALSLLAAQAARAEDYPPCTQKMQDHCRVVAGHGMRHHMSHRVKHHKTHHIVAKTTTTTTAPAPK